MFKLGFALFLFSSETDQIQKGNCYAIFNYLQFLMSETKMSFTFMEFTLLNFKLVNTVHFYQYIYCFLLTLYDI